MHAIMAYKWRKGNMGEKNMDEMNIVLGYLLWIDSNHLFRILLPIFCYELVCFVMTSAAHKWTWTGISELANSVKSNEEQKSKTTVSCEASSIVKDSNNAKDISRKEIVGGTNNVWLLWITSKEFIGRMKTFSIPHNDTSIIAIAIGIVEYAWNSY